MNSSSQTNLCVVTGASGYVGGRLKDHLRRGGLPVVDWNRQLGPGSAAGTFQLGQEVAAEQFAGATALVHCAYDFKARNWADIVETNVRGSEKLLRAAMAGGVSRIVFISSISAFEGCRSMYGRAKLEIERTALSLGATVIRPGLIYGDSPGGVFGGLVRQVKGSRMVPLLGGERQKQYLLHDADLGRCVEQCARGVLPPPGKPITLAHEEGWEMRRLLRRIGEALGKKISFVSVPWRLAWLGLKCSEAVGLRTPFRSDSLISLIYQNDAPSFELAKALELPCRPLAITPAMLA